MIVKMRSSRIGPDQVREEIFIGQQEDSLVLAGTLTLNIGEWQSFGCALLMGADQMHGRLTVVCEGDEEVVCSARAAGEPCDCPPVK